MGIHGGVLFRLDLQAGDSGTSSSNSTEWVLFRLDLQAGDSARTTQMRREPTFIPSYLQAGPPAANAVSIQGGALFSFRGEIANENPRTFGDIRNFKDQMPNHSNKTCTFVVRKFATD
ncbi:hypothetical protein HMPREF1981_01496 [Bacteroides pyogenes F0041]|uniref:Uncharacterized protein n=1 Tax=Bacteroides pyogenes F0041 TaxID=1321819 RepID=U2C598_9BACE|nr:hypothetical protein HMPREF1981_01496 [Bacteroides pyogenes F0041]